MIAIQQAVGGSFQSDPLMLLAMSCSSKAAPEAAAQIKKSFEKTSAKQDLLTRQMLEQGGVPRYGTTEEQEAHLDRIMKKKYRKRSKEDDARKKQNLES